MLCDTRVNNQSINQCFISGNEAHMKQKHTQKTHTPTHTNQ